MWMKLEYYTLAGYFYENFGKDDWKLGLLTRIK